MTTPTRLGCTGTRKGMTDAQKATVARLSAGYREVHHGDCVGADVEMHTIAAYAGQRIVVHPPDDDRLRAGSLGDVIRRATPYLQRNRAIVNETDLLLAAPAGPYPQTGPVGGTWYTIRYANGLGQPVLIVWPDGVVDQLTQRLL